MKKSECKSIIKEEFDKQQQDNPKEYIPEKIFITNPIIIPEEEFTNTISYKDSLELEYISFDFHADNT